MNTLESSLEGPAVNFTVRNTGAPNRVPVFRRRVTLVSSTISKLGREVNRGARYDVAALLRDPL